MKKTIKRGLAISGLLLALATVGCGDNSNANTNNDKAKEENARPVALTQETDENIIDELKIVNGDAVYGNIYLADYVGGKKVSWWSSNPSVVRTTRRSDE